MTLSYTKDALPAFLGLDYSRVKNLNLRTMVEIEKSDTLKRGPGIFLSLNILQKKNVWGFNYLGKSFLRVSEIPSISSADSKVACSWYSNP